MESDPEETTNLYFENPQIVADLVHKFKEIIKNGRSTPGIPQEYIKGNWSQISWV
jgi:arylsulfatase A